MNFTEPRHDEPVALHPSRHPTDPLQEALRPIVSLISKSEKAERKLAPGTWQHTMLRDNLNALRHASALIRREAGPAADFSPEDLRNALRAFASMIGKTEKSRTKFPSGTSQHSLLRNRLQALRVAETLIKLELKSKLTGQTQRG